MIFCKLSLKGWSQLMMHVHSGDYELCCENDCSNYRDWDGRSCHDDIPMMIELLGQIVLFLTLFLNFFWDKCLILTWFIAVNIGC